MKSCRGLRFNCDRLWKLWYSLIVIVMQLLVFGLAISNYKTFKSQESNPKFGNQWNLYPMNIQLASIILSISIFVFFIYSCIFKVGNISNDGIELGIEVDSITNALSDIRSNKGVVLFFSRLFTHILPYSCQIHVIMALFIIIPVPLMQAEQIKNGAISRDWIWKSDLDFVINPYSSSMYGASRQTIFCLTNPCPYSTTPFSLQPEFLNLAVALLIFTVRLPTPFWYTNKAFSILFSMFAFITSICMTMEYQSVMLFVKIYHNDIVQANTIGHWISSWSILILYFIKSLLMLFMLVAVFEYGYTQYLANMRKYKQYFNYDMSDSVSQQSLNNQNIQWYKVAPRLLGSLILVFIVLVSFPILIALIRLYYHPKAAMPVILLGIVSSALYFITCVFFWFGLCIKNKWRFHINIHSTHHPGLNIKSVDSPEPVYGYFANAPSVSSHTSMSKPIMRSSNDGSENGSNRNYVYMHQAVGPIHERSEYSYQHGAPSDISSKSYESNDGNRYSRYAYHGGGISTMENTQYTTLASMNTGSLVLPGSKGAQSESSSSENNFPRTNSRRGSNRVTFKEEHVTIAPTYGITYPVTNDYYSYSQNIHRPDILDTHHKVLVQSNDSVGDVEEGQGEFTDDVETIMSSGINSPTKKFHKDLEISTDMREGTNTADSEINDPRLCSQV